MKKNSNTASRIIEGRAYVILPDQSRLFQLNEVGTFIWDEISRERTVQELVKAVCDEFEVDPETAGKDVVEFLGVLAEKKLVE